MTNYTVKNAILDLGFIDGCLQQHLQPETVSTKYIWEIFDRIGQRILMESLGSGQMLYDLGVIRGIMWLTPMPDAYSNAMDRLMEFFTHGKVDWYQLPQPFTGMEHEDPILSDELRNEIYADYVIEGSDYAIETAKQAGFNQEFIIDRIIPPRVRHPMAKPIRPEATTSKELKESVVATQQEAPNPEQNEATGPESWESNTFNPFNPNGKRGRREWTDEQRAAQAQRAKGQKKPPYDENFAEVKADFDAGLSCGAIGKKWGCSDGHIRNFLTRHGIDPRRPKTIVSAYQPTPRSEYEWSDESRAKLFDLLDQGKTWNEIGDQLGRTPSACRSMHILLVKEDKAPPKKPTTTLPAALSVEDIAEVQNMLDRDASYDEIGEWFGCDVEVVLSFCQEHRLIPQHLAEKVKKGYEERQATAQVQIQPEDDLDPDAPNNDTTVITVPARPDSPAARWKPNPLSPDDWPDIQQMLATGVSREAIAGDYDVPVDDLNAFIEDRLKRNREVKSPTGEALALSQVGSA